jgi:hypothetical protein
MNYVNIFFIFLYLYGCSELYFTILCRQRLPFRRPGDWQI